jgi:uncharacterized ubiquitin-like protein YukD
MVSNKQLKMWKQLWDIFISDGEFRHYYTKYKTYDLLLSDTTPIKGTYGTLYIPPKKREKEGHFIAYQIVGDSILIFDSSAYAYQQFSNNPDLAESIRIRSGKKVVKLTDHPQDLCEGDTFCQTWSLAWLTPSLKSKVKAKSVYDAISSMYEIIHSIAMSDKFVNYMLNPENETSFNNLIKTSQKEFKIPDSTCIINNVHDFVQFSQYVPREYVERIMMNMI